jgi:hypothetical protein
MNRKTLLLVCVALSGAAIAIAIDPGVAAAASQAGDVGQNLGAMLKRWVVPLFGAIAGVVALPYLLKRDVAGVVVFVLLALIVGAFVFVPDQVKTFIGNFWKQVIG